MSVLPLTVAKMVGITEKGTVAITRLRSREEPWGVPQEYHLGTKMLDQIFLNAGESQPCQIKEFEEKAASSLFAFPT